MTEISTNYDATLSHNVDAIVERRLKQLFGLNDISFDGADLEQVARLAAAFDSANFASTELSSAKKFGNQLQLLSYALGQIPPEGIIAEFGVFSGLTINHIASRTERTVFGFDSFEGLPEDWRPDCPKGTFKRELPQVQKNVELKVGWFNESLPGFLETNVEPIALLHVDCDLYSSTKTVFYFCRERIRPGTIIVFDEFFNYVGWRNHEYKAFMELIAETGLRFRYIGYVPHHQQVAVQIL